MQSVQTSINPADEPKFGTPFTDKTLIEYFWNCYRRSDSFRQPVISEARKLYAMYAAQAMTERDMTYIKETFRLPIELPLAKGVIDTVQGIAFAQSLEPNWKGVEQEGMRQSVEADWITQTVATCRHRRQVHREERQAFFDKLITGYGFTDNLLDLSSVPIRPNTEHIEIEHVYWDPDARKPNLEDSRFWIRFRDWTAEEAEARWPDKAGDIRLGIQSGQVSNASPTISGTNKNTRSYSPKGKVRLFDFQYARWETKVVWFDPETGERMNTSLADFNKHQADLEQIAKTQMSVYASQVEAAIAGGQPEPPPPQVPQKIEEVWQYQSPVWYRAYILGNSKESKGLVLSHEPISINQPTIKCDTGFQWKNPEESKTVFFGLMRVVADAQLYLNRAMSDYLETLARGVKGGGFIPKGALGKMKTVEQFLKDAAKPGFWHVVEDGYEGKIVQAQSTAPPAGFSEIFQMMVEMMGRLSGVTEWLQGTGTADRAQTLVSNQQEQGIQMLAPIFEPHKALIVADGQAMAAIALKHLPAAELDKILGPQNLNDVTVRQNPQTAGFVPIPQTNPNGTPITGPDGQPLPVTAGYLLKRVDLLDYDVVVDVATATPTQRAVASQWWGDQGMLQIFLQNGAPAKYLLPEIIEVSPMPGARAKRLADDLRAYFALQEQQQTDQGILSAMRLRTQSDPQGAYQLLQQVQQLVAQQIQQFEGGGEQPAAPGPTAASQPPPGAPSPDAQTPSAPK